MYVPEVEQSPAATLRRVLNGPLGKQEDFGQGTEEGSSALWQGDQGAGLTRDVRELLSTEVLLPISGKADEGLHGWREDDDSTARLSE